MDSITLYPAKLQGTFFAPPSKSLAHRALLCAGLAKGESHISPIDLSQDIKATSMGLEALGAKLNYSREAITIQGNNRNVNDAPIIDCGESGSTLRFLIPLALVLAKGAHFLGSGKLGSRPLTPYESIWKEKNISVTRNESLPGHLDMCLQGSLTPGDYYIPGNISSQFITGLMLALPLLGGDSTIHLTTDIESKGYIDLTQHTMDCFGIHYRWLDNKTIYIKGNQVYTPCNFTVEGDYSQAAVFLCAGALGHSIDVKGLSPTSYQGDKAILPLLCAMGGKVTCHDGTYSFEKAALHGIEIDGCNCPDILPMLALTLALSRGESRIVNAGRLRIKECDRLEATVSALQALGARIRQEGDTMVIEGQPQLEGDATVTSHNDHRMAMMLSIAALHCKRPFVLEGPSAVAKSWPSYWEVYKELGGQFT